MLPSFDRVQFQATTLADVTRQANALVGNLGRALGRLIGPSGIPSLDYVPIAQTPLTGAADTVVNHKLGRQPVGYRLGRVTAAATIYWVAWTSTSITLHASAACNADLEVW